MKFLSFFKQIRFCSNFACIFSATRDNSSVLFSWNFIISFWQKEPIKVQILWNFTWAIESLKFCALMGCFCPSRGSLRYKVSANKVRRSYLSWHWRVMQSLKKNWLLVSNMTWEIWWIFNQPPKSQKISLQWALFV